MKQLPVIQSVPPSPEASASQGQPAEGSSRQARMENDAQKSAELAPQIVKALSTVFDPEIPVNIYDLGLIYDILVDVSGGVWIRMTLTAPACPAAQFLPGQVAKAAGTVPGVTDVKVDVVWEPPWSRDLMSDAAKLQLGMF